MGQGWICLHRKIRNCTLIWDDKPFSRGQAWIDLLLQVNHEDKEILFNGSYLKIERGQTLTSIRKLSEQWGWSRKKTTKFLKELKMGHMLSVKSNNKSTTITIENYGLYQDVGTTKEPQKSHKRTSEEPQRNTNNNDITMKNNEEQKETPLPPLGEKQLSYDFDKHTNLENTKHVLNHGLFDDWQYIKDNPKLWESIKDWMEYKDAKKPKSSNRYVNEKSMRIILGKIVKNCKEYGIDNVINVIEASMGASYQGIVWDWLQKKQANNSGQAKVKYKDALERMDKRMKEEIKEVEDVDLGDFY